jgi:hypothetical protein
MPRKRYTPEEIVAKLRQVEVMTAQGGSVADAVKSCRTLRTRETEATETRPSLAERRLVRAAARGAT